MPLRESVTGPKSHNDQRSKDRAGHCTHAPHTHPAAHCPQKAGLQWFGDIVVPTDTWTSVDAKEIGPGVKAWIKANNKAGRGKGGRGGGFRSLIKAGH